MSTIEVTIADGIASVMLNRPEARNGYTLTMANELAAALLNVNADPHVRVVLISGAGRDFCVGADLSEGGFDVTGDDTGAIWIEPASRVTKVLWAMNKPVIAAIHGAAVGVGSTMILPCDYRLAANDSKFGFVFSRRGIYPEGGSTWFLPRIVGLGRASDWMISGRIIPATEALSAGLVHSLHEPGEVLNAARALAKELVAKTAPVSTAVIRQTLFRMAGEPSPDAAFELDSLLIASITTNPDAIEGVTSFLEKRAPKFTGVVPTDIPAFAKR